MSIPRPLFFGLITFFCLIILGVGLYFGTHSGGFDSESSRDPIDPNDPVAMGRRLFVANCSPCHQTTGLGLPGQFPPLAGSEIVQSQQGWGPNHVVMILLNGLYGPITVKGRIFIGEVEMPFHRETLTDEQIAFILTYIRQEWGNKASPISKEGVTAIRAEIASRIQPWTEAELKAIPAKDLPGTQAPNPEDSKPATPQQTPAPPPKA